MEDEKRLLLSYCCRGALSADEEFSFSSVWYSLATFSSRRKKEGGGGRRRRRERSVIDFRMIDSSRGGRYELGIDRCKPRRPNRRQLPQQQQQSSSSFGGDLVLTAMAEKRKWEKTLQFNYGYIDKGRYVRFCYYYLVFFFFFFFYRSVFGWTRPIRCANGRRCFRRGCPVVRWVRETVRPIPEEADFVPRGLSWCAVRDWSSLWRRPLRLLQKPPNCWPSRWHCAP